MDDKTKEQLEVDLRPVGEEVITYRLYKRRFLGLIGLIMLNLITAMAWPWFGPISNNVADEFGFTLDEVNWIGNICDIAAIALLISAWLRYAGTAKSLSTRSSYAVIMIAQVFAAIAQPIYQVIGPKYSETWFDLKGRTTATMLLAIANPVGAAVGQLISPIVGDPRHSILILGIISTAVIPFVFLVGSAPPTPPTYAGSKPSLSLTSLLCAMLGLDTPEDARMTVRERFDFVIMVLIFGTFLGGANSFGILTGQIMEPVGYSSAQSGLLGACLLLTGIVAAIVTAPLFDRVFTHHLALTGKILVPIVGAAWLSLIWAVKPHNLGGLFAVMTIIGVGSVTMLPVGLELGCELTRNASASSAISWFAGNLFCVIFVLVEGALRAGSNADPPLNMHRALIFSGSLIIVSSASVFGLHGRQSRKERDEQKLQMSLSAQE